MFSLKESKYTYVNEKDRALYTVSICIYMDSDLEVEWQKDAESGHYYPVGYKLDGREAREQEIEQNKIDQETTQNIGKELLQEQVALANEKSDANIQKADPSS